MRTIEVVARDSLIRQKTMRNKFLLLTVAALILGVAAYVWYARQRDDHEGAIGTTRLFPQLEQQLNDIARIRVEHGGERYDVVRHGEGWQLPGKGNFPAVFERVKLLLLGIARLEKVEAKTGKPENYARLGVADPSATNHSFRLSLYAGDRRPVASLIVGRISIGLIAGGKDGIFARQSNDTQTWLTAGRLYLPASPVDWVNRRIIHIKPKDVKRVTITQVDGEALVIEKSNRGAPDFKVVHSSATAVPQTGDGVNLLARGLAGLDMDDVRRLDDADFQTAKAVSAVFETWDGLTVSAYTLDREGHLWVRLKVGVAGLGAEDLSTVRTLPDDVAALRSQLDGWVFQIPRSRGEKLRARLKDLAAAPPGR